MKSRQTRPTSLMRNSSTAAFVGSPGKPGGGRRRHPPANSEIEMLGAIAARVVAKSRRKMDAGQGDLFMPPPMIRAGENGSSADVWFCRRRLVWTRDPSELSMSDDEISAYREKQLRDFDAVFGPPEAWGDK